MLQAAAGAPSVPHLPIDVLRANAYCCLAESLGHPAEMDVTVPSILVETFRQLDNSLRTAGADVAEILNSALGDPEPMAVAYARLFLGPFEMLAPPYESLYRDGSQTLMGPVSRAVADSYAEAGLGVRAGGRQPPDHVRSELEFMYFLAFQAASHPAGIWQERQARFWTVHLSQWLSAFAENMAEAACHPYYTALGKLLLRFVEWESPRFATADEVSTASVFEVAVSEIGTLTNP
jgi:TorA maturation chaperone TorD